MLLNEDNTSWLPQSDLVKIPEALAILKIGRTKLNDMMNADQVHRVKIGRATRITRASIQRIVGEV